jgi:hypothetical protein
MRSILIILFFMLIIISAKSQSNKWQPGHFTDTKGNVETGLIRSNPSGKGPVADEGFIEFKQDEKANSFKLSASDIQSFVVGRDSFVVAHAPKNEVWTKKELDFVKVALDEQLKLYVTKAGSGGGGSGVGFSPSLSTGIGSGGYGYGGMGGGVGINIGGGGGRGSNKITWYFGANTAEMEHLTDENFADVMSEIMADEPEVVEKIRNKEYILGNIEKLIALFEKARAAHKGQ